VTIGLDSEPWPLRLLGAAVDAFLVLGGGVIVLLVFGNVLSRFIFSFDVAWSGELVGFLLLWTTFLGGAAAARRGAHMRIGELVETLRGRPRAAVEALGQALVVLVLLLLVWYGGIIVARTWPQETTVLYWPVGLLYASLPVGALLTLVYVLRDLVRFVSALRGRVTLVERASPPA
jgi:TRAP-type C4-dicarboxylate transport system permease small subunit